MIVIEVLYGFEDPVIRISTLNLGNSSLIGLAPLYMGMASSTIG